MSETASTVSRRPCIVITYPFPIGQRSAGGARYMPEIARNLTRLGAEVYMLTISTNALSRHFPRKPIGREDLGFERDEEFARDSIRHIRVHQNPIAHVLDGYGVKKAVQRILEERPIDLVLSHMFDGSFLPSFLHSRGVRFGYLATWITYDHLLERHPGLRAMARRWIMRRVVVSPYRQADVHFPPSRYTGNELVRCVGVDPQRVVLCPLGVDPSFATIPRTEPEAITNLLFFGRLARLKGFLDAFEALGKLTRKGMTNWKYRLFGAGRLDWARNAVHEHGIDGHVEIHEPIGDEALRRELEWAHLAVMPSYSESFGLSIAEAQMAGLPVVAYDSASVPEVVANGETGWLAPFRDVDRLAAMIETAMRDPAATYRTGLAARERAKRIFDWENTARIILDYATNGASP